MTELTSIPTAQRGLTSARLPQFGPALVGVGAIAIAGLVLLTSVNLVGAASIGAVVFVASLYIWSRFVEGSRAAKNRLMTALIWLAFAVVCIPLGWLIWTVLHDGLKVFDLDFLTRTMRKVSTEGVGGGVAHALVGSLIVTAGAAIIAVPLGIMCAIYLVEYGRGSRLSRVVTILVDVMTGIPSIVAGLFAVAMFTLIFGQVMAIAFAASVALSILMTPTIVRATEEMLRLVPDDLREASYALGVPKWRTITKVVLRTSVGGILTGVTLATARVIGETAPILVVLGTVAPKMNLDPFHGHMQTLPTFILDQKNNVSAPSDDRMWAAALTLILLVMILNLIARLIGKIFAPKTGR
ncbi:phosphate transport system permease protein PstA [Nocardioides baekrokdamisoli]|uniref:Phosphate transport system permease protein PstA n=1 Tax=Nocardioides baekrokdamisoli TaxID=1804624 RepID=A0A3G9IU47_9ACTN|nr:phosphate ABC transporter permease PstA [Nocardioides baekrokdamisoli]BBH17151.1 phosphate transport system permease protein PstA [Nocardioides baekrokdamisoli]